MTRPSVAYCTKRIKDPAAARKMIETFRAMRGAVAPAGAGAQDVGPGGHDRRRRVRGRPRRILHGPGSGDQAPLAVPLYLRLRAGQRLRRLHPRPAGFDRGGYQVWTGLHSFLERGTGEEIVAEAVQLLDRLQAGVGDPDAR